MKLSDIMGAADLSIYAQVGLVLFLLSFLVVVIRIYFFDAANELEEANNLPFDNEVLPGASTNTSKTSLAEESR